MFHSLITRNQSTENTNSIAMGIQNVNSWIAEVLTMLDKALVGAKEIKKEAIKAVTAASTQFKKLTAPVLKPALGMEAMTAKLVEVITLHEDGMRK